MIRAIINIQSNVLYVKGLMHFNELSADFLSFSETI